MVGVKTGKYMVKYWLSSILSLLIVFCGGKGTQKQSQKTQTQQKTQGQQQQQAEQQQGQTQQQQTYQGPPTWTFFVYMVGSDLESKYQAASADLSEMKKAGSSQYLNVVVLIGGARKGKDYDFSTVKLLKLEGNEFKPIADWGKLNMGDPETLKKFLTEVVPKYKGMRNALIFWDHGSGFMGYGADELFNNDDLPLPEIRKALSEAKQQTGIVFDIIGFDACLMATIEVAWTVKDFARLLVASEEIEPGHGWDYTGFLSALKQNYSMSITDLAKTIVDTYKKHAEDYGNKIRSQGANYNDDKVITLSVIDLSKVDGLAKAVGELAEALRGKVSQETFNNRPTYLKVSDANFRAQKFKDVCNGKCSIDLYDLVEKIKSGVPDIAQQADKVLNELKNVVIYSVKGVDRPRAYGLSIFFPENADIYYNPKASQPFKQTSFAQSNTWSSFLDSFFNLGSQDTYAPQFAQQPNIYGYYSYGYSPLNPKQELPTIITAQIDMSPQDIQEVYAIVVTREIIDGQDWVIFLGSSFVIPDEQGNIWIEWDGRWIFLCSGENCIPSPFSVDDIIDENTLLISVPAIQTFSDGTSDAVFILFEFDLQNLTGIPIVSVPVAEGNQVPKIVYPVSPGDEIQPFFVGVSCPNDECKLKLFPGEKLKTVQDGLAMKLSQIDQTVYVGFVAFDYEENIGLSEFVVCQYNFCQTIWE